jgi:site-specific DNA recombinase
MDVFGYVRVSTDRQDLERQKQQISDFCNAKNHRLLHIFSEKISGATEIDDREELSLLMQKTNHDADLVVISEMSRYSRQDDLVEVVYSIARLLKRGLSLIFLDNKDKIYEANSTLSIEEIIMLIAKAYANAEERKKIFERMYSRKIQLIEKYHNVLIGNNIPFGFKAVSNPKYNSKKSNGEPKTFLEEDEYEKEVIIELFNRSAEGETYRELQKYFDSKNRRPLQNNKRRKAKYGDKPRQAISVAQILRNTLYCGDRVHHIKDFKTGESKPYIFPIKPMVSKELFQKSLDAHKKNGEVFDKTHICANPLKGLIKCYCGASMALATIRGKKVYTCFKSKKASKVEAEKWCGNFGISQELLMDIVNYDVKHGLNEDLREKYDKATTDALQTNRERIRKFQTEFETLNTKQRSRIADTESLYKSLKFADSDIVRKKITMALGGLENEIEATKIDLDELEQKINSLREYERSIIAHNQNFVVEDCNSDEFPKYLQSIIDKVVYRGYDVINGLVMIIYKNGFISYYAVRKPRYRRCHYKLMAEITPISDEFIKFDENGRVILINDDSDKIELTSIEQVRELVKNGNRVTIFGEKIREFKQRYINN